MSIHYEVFQRRSKAGGWSLHGAFPTRDIAIKEAKGLINEGGAVGVRVFKETFKPETGDYMTLKVLEEGEVADPKKKSSDTTSLPCFKAEDFYSFHGRRSIGRLLKDALGRWRITATELLHHTGHIERLELTGTVMQGAVQKAAIKHAGATGEPVQQIVKQLNELISRAIQRVVLDERNSRLPRIGAAGFGALCEKFADVSGAEYYLNAAIAWHIEDAASWNEKFDTVIGLLNALPADGPARAIGLSVVDSLVADMLEGGAALGDLLGEQRDLGAALLKMADLFLGRLANIEDERPGVVALQREFLNGNLVSSRAAIAQRILTEIKGARRLSPESLDEEVKMMRMLATRMAMGEGKLVSHEEILDAFTARSKQLVMPGTVERYLSGASNPDAKIEKLYTLEENVIGVANKRELVGFIIAVLGSPRTEQFFIDSNDAPSARLQILAGLQKRNKRAGLQDLEKRQVADRIDQVALQIERKTLLIDGLLRSAPDPIQAAGRVLSLIVGGTMPEGALSELARERVREWMKRPAFKSALGAADATKVEALGQLIAQANLDGGGAKSADAA